LDKTARALIQFLNSQDPNLRMSAMRVVTALELRDASVIRALGASLDSDVETLRVQALQALAQLGPAQAVHLVAPMLLEAGAVRQQAARVLALGGASSIPVLRKSYEGADHHGKRAIASTLAEIGGRPAFDFLLRAMPPEDLELIKHLTACSRAVLVKLAPAARLAAVRSVRTFLRDRKTQKNPHAVIAGLILLGGVSDPKAAAEVRRMLDGFLDARQPESVRRNAAVSMAHLPVASREAVPLLQRLVPLLCEKDWSPLPQNLLPLLQKMELPPTAATKLLPLLRSPHVAVQVHALERLRGIDKAPVVQAVLPFLTAEHPRLREAAEAALKTMPSAIDSLLAMLRGRSGTEAAQRVQWILRAYPEAVRRRYAAGAAKRALELHESNEPQAAAFVDFVCGADPGQLQKSAAARIAALRRSTARNRGDRTLALFKLLADRNLLQPNQRYEYGLLLLRQSRKDVRREARATDPSLHVLAGVAREDGAKFVRALVHERGLGAEDFFYLGFHLSEADDRLRPAGQTLLSHVLATYPRHKLGRAAKQKLELLERHGASGEA
jgi:HEAT repeat protein